MNGHCFANRQMPDQGREPCGPVRSGNIAKSRIHRSEEHTSELQSLAYLVCRLLLEKKKNNDQLKRCCARTKGRAIPTNSDSRKLQQARASSRCGSLNAKPASRPLPDRSAR